ncbi:unnamed protein product [Protopolystoma xenopodis]|uniref:MalT-like TPR region domain-containing protein n=1 Tax=Protopolystoma xenopodis TaxID=117903 RepID=A0A3S5C2R5_9PLAT|nr:unnamed protein product [Protopolystoma xenopodis]
MEAALLYSEQGNITCMMILGDHELALAQYSILLDIWKEKKEPLQVALSHRYLAECYLELNSFNEAISHTGIYLNISKQLKDKIEEQRAYVTLGRCFLTRASQLKDGSQVNLSLKASKQAFLNSLKACESIDTLDQSSHVMREQLNHKQAEEHFKQCIIISKKYSLPKIILRSAYQLGEMTTCSFVTMSHPNEVISNLEELSLCQSASLIK